VVAPAAALVAAITVVGAAGEQGREVPAGAATVVEVIDGDTLVVDLPGGDGEHVRLIGIDTPESVARDRPDECFGAEASRELGGLVPPGTALRVERDVEARDRYGRLLAYVYRASDGLFVNLALVTSGHAEVLTYEPNTAHRTELEQAERDARASGAGLWGACGSADVALE
jgi:micrococcal nuclease